jgi:3',5'-cyclic-nucleotide phosphodiesterase
MHGTDRFDPFLESNNNAHAPLAIEGGADTLGGLSVSREGRGKFGLKSNLRRRKTDESNKKITGSRLWKRGVSFGPLRLSTKKTPRFRSLPASLDDVLPETSRMDDRRATDLVDESAYHPDGMQTMGDGFVSMKRSMTSRRSGVDVNTLTMGLDAESANFLDFMTQAKCEDWLRSLSRRDPRACIKMFFDDVARDGADRIEEDNGFQPELLSPLLAMFQRSSVFSVWRPTSVDSIRKMMTGQGTGKGLDIKGKSAKKGKLSAYVPFMQIHEDGHKTKIRSLPRDGRIRVFYKKREARDKAHVILSEVMGDMIAATDAARLSRGKSARMSNDYHAEDEDTAVSRIISSLRRASDAPPSGRLDLQAPSMVNEWVMDNPSIILIDDYIPNCFGLDLPKRLFWEGYVMRAKDISREPESMYDTGRPSRASFQDMNFASIKNEWKEDSPRAVVWQYTDPYLPPNEPDPDPMMPQTLLMAYEENGRVMPVVSDFDCFLLGTRGVRFQNHLPKVQVELVHEMISGVETILKDRKKGEAKNWTASWLNVMKHSKSHITMPKYGFGDPKSYAIMKHAVHRLEEFGAVRHGAECFNFYFPQELDDEFLVVRGSGSNLPIPKYKYMKVNELQNFLSGCIDIGFCFPLNPKWVLCDSGWKALWDKLTGSNHPNVQLSINAWYPPGSGLKERIEDIHRQYPEGFESDHSDRKQGTQAWDEAELALERYNRIQRAKRKLWCFLSFISILQQSQEKVRARHAAAKAIKDVEVKEGSNVNGADSLLGTEPGHRAVSWSTATTYIADECNVEAIEPPAKFGDRNTHVRTQSAENLFRRTRSLSPSDEDNIDVIDSILNSFESLSDHQKVGLQRIREQLVNPPRIHTRRERRHSSADGRLSIAATVFDEVPAFILNEYGGLKGDAPTYFKDQVKKIVNAHRLMGAHRCGEKWSPCGNEHFLPVEWTTLNPESKQRLAEKLSFDALSRWDFNMIEFAKLSNGSPLLFVGWAIMGSPCSQQAMAIDLGQDSRVETNGYNFVTQFSIHMPILCSFFRTVEADYLSNPYHNNTHAADVLQTLNTMLQLGGKEYASSPLDLFSILVAAVIHDVRHPGLNNNFQINTHSELAIQFNDISVLENNSIAWLFKKLLGQNRDFTIDIFNGLSDEQFSKMRVIIIRSVLETDMTHHFSLLKRMGIHQEMLRGKETEEWFKSYTIEGVKYDPSIDMLCFLLHQADISNPAKPFPMFTLWAEKILAESYAQGDQEASLSLSKSPLCDRLTTDKKQSQIGFIKFVVQPSYQLLGDILPLFEKTVSPHIERSLEYWEEYKSDDSFLDGRRKTFG